MNLMAVSIVFSSVMLLAVFDASAHLAQGFHKDAEYIAQCIIPKIRALPNPYLVDLIICDGAADMTKFRELISVVFPWILSIWCVSHITNRILAMIGAIEKVNELIIKGKVIVDCFAGSKHFEHSLFESKSFQFLKKRRALLRYCDTRFGLYFVMLHRIVQLKTVLVSCVTCPQWLDRYPEGQPDEVKDIIMDQEFWKEVSVLITVVWPIIQLLRIGDSNKPSLFAIYKATVQTKERFETIGERFEVPYIEEVQAAFEEYEGYLLSKAAKVSHKK